MFRGRAGEYELRLVKNSGSDCGLSRPRQQIGVATMADFRSSARSETGQLQLAARLRQVGRLAESLVPMERAAQMNPTDPLIQHDLGLTYLNLERIEEATQCFWRATVLKSDFAHAHYRLGIALELQGRSDEAIVYYQRAVALWNSLADAQSRLGGLFASRGRSKEAAAAFRAAAAAATDATEGRIVLVRALLAEGNNAEGRDGYSGAASAKPAYQFRPQDAGHHSGRRRTL